MASPKKLTLDTLGGGELAAKVDRALAKICENIADPNVRTEAVRKLKIGVKIKPDKKGQMAQIVYEVKTEIPGPDPGETSAYIAMDHTSKEIALYGVDVRQSDLFDPPKEPMVTEIRSVSQPQRVAPAPQPAAIAPAPAGD